MDNTRINLVDEPDNEMYTGGMATAPRAPAFRPPEVFAFIDYREYLAALHQALRDADPRFSYRAFARAAGSTSPNYLQLILAGKMAPTSPQLKALSSFVGLGPRERQYLRTLVAFDRARTLARREALLRSALRLARSGGVRHVSLEKHEYYATWYHSAVRAVLGYHEVKQGREDFALLGRMLRPRISADKARSSVALLMDLGLVQVDDQGYYRQSAPVLSARDELQSHRVVQYQAATMRLALEALQNCPPDLRDMSTLTLNISEKAFRTIRKRVQEFRAELIGIARIDTGDDRVYQFNMQLFPMALPEQDEGTTA